LFKLSISYSATNHIFPANNKLQIKARMIRVSSSAHQYDKQKSGPASRMCQDSCRKGRNCHLLSIAVVSSKQKSTQFSKNRRTLPTICITFQSEE